MVITAREHVHTCVAGNVQTEPMSWKKPPSHCAEGNLGIIATSSECEKAAGELGYLFGGDAYSPYHRIGGCMYLRFAQTVLFSKNLKVHGCHIDSFVNCLCKKGLYTACAPHVRLVMLAIRGCSRSYPSNSDSHPVCTVIQ